MIQVFFFFVGFRDLGDPSLPILNCYFSVFFMQLYNILVDVIYLSGICLPYGLLSTIKAFIAVSRLPDEFLWAAFLNLLGKIFLLNLLIFLSRVLVSVQVSQPYIIIGFILATLSNLLYTLILRFQYLWKRWECCIFFMWCSYHLFQC